MNQIIELKRNRQIESERRTNNTYMGKFAITKERGKNNTCCNQKGSTSTACDDKTMQKTQTTELCVEKLFFKDNNQQEL